MVVIEEDETRKQIAAGSDEQGIPFRASFDPFNMIMQQLNKLDSRLDRLDDRIDRVDARFDKVDARFDKVDDRIGSLDGKIDRLRGELRQEFETRMDSLHSELHGTTRWIVGTIIAAAGVAVGLGSWLL